jgi:hypothetical protein
MAKTTAEINVNIPPIEAIKSETSQKLTLMMVNYASFRSWV